MGGKEKGRDADEGKNKVMLMCQNEITEKWICYFQLFGEKMVEFHTTVHDTLLVTKENSWSSELQHMD